MHAKLLRRWRSSQSSDSHLLSRRKKPSPILTSSRKWWHLWLRLTGPDVQYIGKSIEEQENLRRSRLLSAMLPLAIVAICTYIPSAFSKPENWVPIIIIGLCGLIVTYLNQQGKVTAAGLIYALAVDASITISLFNQHHGMNNSDIPDFDVFALSILLTGMFLKRSFIPIIALLHLIIGFVSFNIIPHDSLLTQEIRLHLDGNANGYLEDFFLLEVCTATVAWLNSFSFSKALKRADRAEELDQLVQQQRLLLEEVNRLYQEKARASETDAITDLFNHRAIMNRLSEQVVQCQENKGSIVLLFMDLDHFKSVNDTWGHRAGDMVLRETGQRIQSALPENACVGRYGGEEFAILLNDVDLLSASQIAENIRTTITTTPYIWLTENTQQEIQLLVTVSIGVAIYGLHGTTVEMMIEYADRAMYCAKELGRNRVCIADIETTDKPEEFITKVDGVKVDSIDTVVIHH